MSAFNAALIDSWLEATGARAPNSRLCIGWRYRHNVPAPKHNPRQLRLGQKSLPAAGLEGA